MAEANSTANPSQHVDDTEPFKRRINVFKQQIMLTPSGRVIKNGVSRVEYKVALDGFAESARVGMDILSSIAEIHPFIKAPVMAFKLVLGLDLKRRENNAKVQSLQVEMVDMMSEFIQLDNLSGNHDFNTDANLMELMKDISEEITVAFNLSDHYMKKSLLVKCLKSPVYEIRFAKYAQRFHNLGARINRALSIHTIGTISRMDEKVDNIQDMMKTLFLVMETRCEKDLRRFIEKSGGPQACIESDPALEGLISKVGAGMPDEYRKDGSLKIHELKSRLSHELLENIDEALKQNMKLFEKKLDMLDLQLHAINLKLTTETERVITALSGGHERIVDEGGKTTVKARNFVLAIRDYYLHGLHVNYQSKVDEAVLQISLDSAQKSESPSLPSPTALNSESDVSLEPPSYISPNSDIWAFEYINMSYLQPIAEAIDDDGSGFISVKEVNDFTNSCPKSWSMLQWIAYWAAGWHSSVNRYAEKIYGILKELYRLRDIIRPENIGIVDYYLEWSLDRVKKLLKSTSNAVPQVHPELTVLRDEFCQEEEAKLEANLEKMSYNVDSRATVTLVTGPHRIERFATLEVPNETLVDDWNAHHHDLYDNSDLDYGPEDIPLSILQYEPQDVYELPPPSPRITNVMNAHNQAQDSIGGKWAGILINRPVNRPSVPFRGVMRICLGDPVSDTGVMSGTGDCFSGPLSVKGFALPTQGKRLEVDLIIDYGLANSTMWIRCLGVFDPISSTITGEWHSNTRTGTLEPPPAILNCKPEYDPSKGDRIGGTFQFSRTPASLIRFRYSPEAFAQNAPKARWDFARASILYMIRCDRMSKDHMISVLRDIRVFIELCLKMRKHYSEFQSETWYQSLVKICPTIDSFVYSMAQDLAQRKEYHM
ncbi:hypothetical protein H0H92_009489 [Tricholoma furcatifolium]|nr:hypothetical protein H0H92_009489 [Tricholoma furcatifolium]